MEQRASQGEMARWRMTWSWPTRLFSRDDPATVVSRTFVPPPAGAERAHAPLERTFAGDTLPDGVRRRAHDDDRTTLIYQRGIHGRFPTDMADADDESSGDSTSTARIPSAELETLLGSLQSEAAQRTALKAFLEKGESSSQMASDRITLGELEEFRRRIASADVNPHGATVPMIVAADAYAPAASAGSSAAIDGWPLAVPPSLGAEEESGSRPATRQLDPAPRGLRGRTFAAWFARLVSLVVHAMDRGRRLLRSPSRLQIEPSAPPTCEGNEVSRTARLGPAPLAKSDSPHEAWTAHEITRPHG